MGELIANGHPVIAVLAAIGIFVIWFVKLAVGVLRRALAEKVADAVGADFHRDDER